MGLQALLYARGVVGSPTMRVAVRTIVFPDFEPDSDFDPDDCVQLVEIVAGPSDGPGEELFQAQVCTPAALSRMLADGEVRSSVRVSLLA
jgi:immunity protein 8 of polymorphic toxin system